jgi:hypothetical protein
MSIVLILVLSIHGLAGVFWAGTTFTLVRTGGLGGERLFRPQMGAAALAVLSGAYLWSLAHPASVVLMIGAAAALVAAGAQGALAGPAVRSLQRGAVAEANARKRIALAQRIAAGLLAATVITMVVAPHV